MRDFCRCSLFSTFCVHMSCCRRRAFKTRSNNSQAIAVATNIRPDTLFTCTYGSTGETPPKNSSWPASKQISVIKGILVNLRAYLTNSRNILKVKQPTTRAMVKEKAKNESCVVGCRRFCYYCFIVHEYSQVYDVTPIHTYTNKELAHTHTNFFCQFLSIHVFTFFHRRNI